MTTTLSLSGLPKQKVINYSHCLLWLGLGIGALMLLLFPLAKPVWDDELDSIMQGSKSYLTILSGASDTQPPLHFLILRVCESFFGKNLAAFRFVSSLPALGTLWYVYLLGRRINEKTGILALWLAALSPGLILFDRMARYHGLLAMLATMSIYYGLTLFSSGKRRDAVAFGITTFLMLMTYYLSLFVIIAELLVIVPRWRQQPYLKQSLTALALSICGFLPWFVHGLLFAQHNMKLSHVEDPAMSLGFHGFLLRLGLPLYSFAFGETVNPWYWPVVLTGIIVFCLACWQGSRFLFARPEFVLVAVVVCVAVLSAVATSGRLGTGQTVGSMAKRVSFVLPLLYVIISAGMLSLRYRALQIGCICAVLFISTYAVTNYWRNVQFLNQNYVARWDQAIAVMHQHQWGSSTLVISCADPALHYYLDREVQPVNHVNAAVPSEINLAFARYHPRYLWLVSRDRGDRVATSATESVNRDFAASYMHIGTYALMPRSASDRYWLQKILKRPASPNYLWLDLYDTQGKPLKPVSY